MVKRAFFNITIGGEDQGRIVFELWDEVIAPLALPAGARRRRRAARLLALAWNASNRRMRWRPRCMCEAAARFFAPALAGVGNVWAVSHGSCLHAAGPLWIFACLAVCRASPSRVLAGDWRPRSRAVASTSAPIPFEDAATGCSWHTHITHTQAPHTHAHRGRANAPAG